MGFRFRKSKSIGPFRLNLSKSGFGFSVGIPGLRHTWLANGRERTTYSLPGTGLSYVEESGKKNFDIKKDAQKFDNKLETNLFGIIIISVIIAVLCNPQNIFSTTIFVALVLFTPLKIKELVQKNSKNYKLNECYQSALMYMKEGAYAKAIEKFQMCKEIDLCNINKLIYDCYVLLKDYSSALTFIENNRIGKDTRDEILFLYAQLEEPKKALEFSQKMYSDSARNTVERIAFEAKCYMELNQHDLALETLLRGPYKKRTMDKIMCLYRYCLAECYEKLGDNKKALKEYQKIFAYNQEFEDVKMKIEKINKKQ